MQRNLMRTNLARYDKGISYQETYLTDEGYIKGRAIVTRTGVFLYKNADGTVRKELRHPDDVRQPESLETIKMIPVVDGHPTERLLSAANAKRLSVGFTGELVEDEPPYIIANMVITDKDMVHKIRDKTKNELSLGYTVDLIEEDGTYQGEPYDFRQTNIRYNHLALVDEARAGPEARIALDGDDAVLVQKQEIKKMANKKPRKVKIDAQEYMLEDEAAEGVEGLMKRHESLMSELAACKEMLDKAHAERDSMRDKDHHDPKMVHEPLSGEMSEQDEIGKNGKEAMDPNDTYGMQSHVRDYEKPTHMENHAVMSPKNEHYPRDLPHVAKVDAAEINRRVNDRVRLVNLSNRYLDKNQLARLDSMSDVEIKKSIIYQIQKTANLDGKNEMYVNTYFDSVLAQLPREKVIATPSRIDANEDPEKSRCDAVDARKKMIQRQKSAWMPNKGRS